MYHPVRMLALFGAVVGLECTIAGAAFANELMGGQVEELQIILSFLSFLFLGILGTIFGFAKWFLKHHSANALDPETLRLLRQMQTDFALLTERFKGLDDTQKKIVEHLGESMAERKLKPEWDKDP